MLAAHATRERSVNPLDWFYTAPTKKNARHKAERTLLRSTIQNIITRRRQEQAEGSRQRHNDLLEYFLEAHDDDSGKKFSDNDLLDELLTMMFAGYVSKSFITIFRNQITNSTQNSKTACKSEIWWHVSSMRFFVISFVRIAILSMLTVDIAQLRHDLAHAVVHAVLVEHEQGLRGTLAQRGRGGLGRQNARLRRHQQAQVHAVRVEGVVAVLSSRALDRAYLARGSRAGGPHHSQGIQHVLAYLLHPHAPY